MYSLNTLPLPFVIKVKIFHMKLLPKPFLINLKMPACNFLPISSNIRSSIASGEGNRSTLPLDFLDIIHVYKDYYKRIKDERNLELPLATFVWFLQIYGVLCYSHITLTTSYQNI